MKIKKVEPDKIIIYPDGMVDEVYNEGTSMEYRRPITDWWAITQIKEKYEESIKEEKK